MTAHDRLTAALADRYRIQREIGAGGMATVYVAHDIRHDRSVAVKILRPELSAAIGADRFLAEIRTTANLQHPNILALFDSGQAGELLYYVMPFIDGETLRDRLDREKQLPIADAVRIASEVASALDYAHRHGVIHRDIKPSNILFHDGRALVADFGIALAASKAGKQRMTHTGMTLGTPHYMSPEQGMADRNLTPRSDIYSLGAMTYEMLAGEPPFTGPTAQAILAKVLTAEPTPPRELRKSIPPHVESAVLTSLEKLPADRFASAAEFSSAINDGSLGDPSDPLRRAHPSFVRRPRSLVDRVGVWRLAVAAGIVVVAATAGWMLRSTTAKPQASQPVRMAFSIGMPGVDRSHIEISPDGRQIIQVVSDSTGVDRIVMRDLASTKLVSIQGSEGATDPVFSPDGEWISFNSDGKLRKVPTAGGPPVEIADSAAVGGGAWLPDGNIVFTRDGRGLWIVSNTGGAARQLTSLDTARKEFNHWYPQALPSGKAVIYTSYATPIGQARVEAYDFASKKKKVLVTGAVYGRYSPSGHLLYSRDGAIFAVPFDAKTLSVQGTPVPVEEDVSWVATDGLGGFAISRTGTLAFLKSSEWNVERRVIWSDRTGREEAALPGPGAYAEPRLSPDGKWIVITITEPRRELWLYGIGGAALTPLSRTDEAAFNAVWAPDSKSVVYSHENPVYDLHRIAIDGSALDQSVVSSKWDKYATSISPDGRSLAYIENNNSDRILITEVDGTAAPRALTVGATAQRSGTFSPDGRWMAYEELSHGQPDIYITPAKGTGGRQKVSIAGGEQPRWTKGGHELIYRRGDAVMAASMDIATGKSGTPVELFHKTQPDRLGGGRTYTYDVAPDGNRFLLVVPVQQPSAQPAIVVLNWVIELDRKLRRAK